MKFNARSGLLAAMALSLAIGCVRKREEAQNKSIVNGTTGEKLDEVLLTVPAMSPDGSGTISTDPESIKKAVINSIAYCYVSHKKDGTFESVTSRYVRASEVTGLLDSLSPTAGASAESVQNGFTALGVAAGGTAAATLQLTDKPRSMSLDTFDALLRGMMESKQAALVESEIPGKFFVLLLVVDEKKKTGNVIKYSVSARGKLGRPVLATKEEAIAAFPPKKYEKIRLGQALVELRRDVRPDGSAGFTVNAKDAKGTTLNPRSFKSIEEVQTFLKSNLGLPEQEFLKTSTGNPAAILENRVRRFGEIAAFRKMDENQVRDALAKAGNLNLIDRCLVGGVATRATCVGVALTAVVATAVTTNHFLGAKNATEQAEAIEEHYSEMENVTNRSAAGDVGTGVAASQPTIDPATLTPPEVTLDDKAFGAFRTALAEASAKSDLPECVPSE